MFMEGNDKNINFDIDEISKLLNEKFIEFNREEFIKTDPIQIPKLFTQKEDIEISGFLTATIAWGNRKMIINNSYKLLNLMDNAPLDFILNANEKDFLRFKNFTHRTFNGTDAVFFMKSLANIYRNHGGLEKIFVENFNKHNNLKDTIIDFRKIFLSTAHEKRSEKHIANVEKKSAAKRINMFLRWMVRKDNLGVDFGLWNIPASELMMPLDVHSGNVSRKLGLLTRKQNDWIAVEELTQNLRLFDKNDPVKYDFALFGMGVFDKF